MPIRFDDIEKKFANCDRSHVGISDGEIVELASAFRLYGFWRMDLETGHFFATQDIYTLFGMEFTTGPMNLVVSNSRVHPEDLPMLVEAFESCIQKKIGYHAIYRLKNGDGHFKFVRSVGKYRENANGKGEVVGITYEFFERLRAVGFVGDGSENNARL